MPAWGPPDESPQTAIRAVVKPMKPNKFVTADYVCYHSHVSSHFSAKGLLIRIKNIFVATGLAHSCFDIWPNDILTRCAQIHQIYTFLSCAKAVSWWRCRFNSELRHTEEVTIKPKQLSASVALENHISYANIEGLIKQQFKYSISSKRFMSSTYVKHATCAVRK